MEKLHTKNPRQNIVAREVLGTEITGAFRICAVYFIYMLDNTNKGFS